MTRSYLGISRTSAGAWTTNSRSSCRLPFFFGTKNESKLSWISTTVSVTGNRDFRGVDHDFVVISGALECRRRCL